MLVRALLRVLHAVCGAAAAGVVVAALEARAVATSSLEAGTEAPPPLLVALADLGVLAPVVALVAVMVAVATVVVEPEGPRSPIDYLVALRGGSVIERLRAAAACPLAVFATFAWCVGSAHLARVGLAVGTPLDAGLTVAVGSVLLCLGALAVASSLVPFTRRLLALGSGAVPFLLDPVVTGGAALLATIALFALGVRSGGTGGEGGVLAIFGVFKREELDLRPALNAGIVGLGAYLGPVVLGRGKLSRSRRIVGVAAGAASLVLLAALTSRADRALAEEESVARGLEGHAPLGKIALAGLRRATDGDHDGFSSRFGGGDCDDRDPAKNPGALDVPGNGVDEDCSGADTPIAEGVADPGEAPEGDAGRDAAPKRTYNVILLTIDTLRIDLGFMGYDKPVSPNLDRLAAEATVFERAYSMASYTGKSVGPMLIGRYPSETARDFSHFNTYAAKNVFVAERARDAGYRTFAAHCHWYFRMPTGLNQGFDVWDTTAIPPGMGDNDTTITSDRMSAVALRQLASPENTSPSLRVEAGDAGDAGANDGGAGEAGAPAPHGAAANGRFFAWFHFFDPHAQYVAHAGAPDMTRGPGNASKALYDQEVWYTDQHIGRVLDYVRAQPWAADTAIVVTSDHGEAFADHGMSWHGAEIWESLVRVPLVVYVPGEKPRRVSVKRSHIDLAPTLLELMGASPTEPGELSGTSLMADVRRDEGQPHPERDVLVDMPAGPHNGLRRALITGETPGMKLLHFGGATYSLYDLAEDPAEKKDLARDKEKLKPMIERLQAVRARLKEIEVRAPR